MNEEKEGGQIKNTNRQWRKSKKLRKDKTRQDRQNTENKRMKVELQRK